MPHGGLNMALSPLAARASGATFTLMRIIFSIALAIWTAAAALAQTAFPTDLTLTHLSGAPAEASAVRFARPEGPTVVALWATWCAPCKQELDAYRSHYATWAREFGAEVYAVSVDRPRARAKVEATVAEKAWPFPVLFDGEQVLMQRLGVASIPQVFVVAPDGTIAYSHSGFAEGDVEALAAELRRVAERGEGERRG